MHDAVITDYTVDIKNAKIIIHTDKGRTFEAFGVLTHSFECILESNIIFDIAEYDIADFIRDNAENINKHKNNCWPVDYDTAEGLCAYLKDNGYKYIVIAGSLGLNGFVLAKGYKIYK